MGVTLEHGSIVSNLLLTTVEVKKSPPSDPDDDEEEDDCQLCGLTITIQLPKQCYGGYKAVLGNEPICLEEGPAEPAYGEIGGYSGTPPPRAPIDLGPITVRNGALGFTRSEYGAMLPIIYGAYRVDGNVIWASDLETSYYVIDGEKLQASYVNFALGLAEGEASALLRIWYGDRLVVDNSMNVNDETLAQPNASGYIFSTTVDLLSEDSPLRGVSGLNKDTTIEIYQGSETQVPDPTMVAQDGELLTPAYRGLTYIMFKNFLFGPDDGSLPPIYVEVLSNTAPTTPKLYGAQMDPSVHFDQIEDSIFGGMDYDPVFDLFFITAEGGPTQSPPNGRGFWTHRGNTLEAFSEVEIVETLDQGGNFVYGASVGTSNGWRVVPGTDGSGSHWVSFNPASGLISGYFPAGGSISGSTADGPAISTHCASIPTRRGIKSVPTDIICSVSEYGDSVSFMECTPEGTIAYLGYANGVLRGDSCRAVPLYVNAAQYAATPTFKDREHETEGAHFVLLSQQDDVEVYGIQVHIATVDQQTATKNYGYGNFWLDEYDFLYYADLGIDAYAEFVFAHNINGSTDLLICLNIDGDNDLIFRYDVINRTIKWKTTVPYIAYNAKTIRQMNMLLVDTKFAYIDEDEKINVINLQTGAFEVHIEDMAAAGLPAAGGTNVFQYYNGLEDSITYTSSDSSRFLVKAFINRTSRSQVGVKNVVASLLSRVGVQEADFVGDDVQALTVRGYAIKDRKTLRTVFGELAQVYKFDVIESNGLIAYKSRGETPSVTIPVEHLAMTQAEGWCEEHDENDLAQTRKIDLSYEDIGRDYGENVQSVILPKYARTSFDDDAGVSVSSPIVLNSQEAKELAELLLYAKSVYAKSFKFKLPPRYMNLDPSDVITVEKTDGVTSVVRLREVAIGGDYSVECEATLDDPTIYDGVGTLFGVTGTFRSSTFKQPAGRVEVANLLIPFRTQAAGLSRSGFHDYWFCLLNVAPNATLPPVSVKVIAAYESAVDYSAPTTFPTWGYVTQALTDTGSLFATDRVSTMRVKMMSTTGAALANATSRAAMIDDERINLAYVGGELVQFQQVTDLGDDIYEFRYFNRAKQGTDQALYTHTTGEYFVLLADNEGTFDNTSFIQAAFLATANPSRYIQIVPDNGSPMQNAPVFNPTSRTMRPWSVAGFVESWATNDFTLTWQYRNRHSGMFVDDMSDGALTPVEAEEKYAVWITDDVSAFNPADSATYLRTTTVSTNSFTYTQAQQIADSFDPATDELYVLIAHVGSATGLDTGNFAVHRVISRQ